MKAPPSTVELEASPGVGEMDVAASPGVVDIWRVDLREVGAEPARLLSAQERERAARIANPARRALWMRGRGALRMLLGGYLEQAPREIDLETGKHGKLALSGGALNPGGFHFNLSHSGPLALYAFTSVAPVGIDLEIERERERDDAALAERVFGSETARRMRELSGPARKQEFLRLWVRHEAALKCLGTGLAESEALATGDAATGDTITEAGISRPWIADLDLSALGGGVVAARRSAETSADMRVQRSAETSPAAFAAVAVLSDPLKLRRRDWPFQAG